MKRTLSLWLGTLALAAFPVLAQAPAAQTGKIHGHVINPSGAPQSSGNVTAVLSNKPSEKGTVFQVNQSGEFSGELPPATYNLIFRQPDTPPDKQVDHIDNVKVVAGQTIEQDIDMSRKEYISSLPPEEQKKLEEIRKRNSEALKANEVIKNLNADLKTVGQEIHDADMARATAVQQLGAGATKQALDAKEAEIKNDKYGHAEELMTKDSAARPDASILWARLGQAQLGLKKYDAAEVSFKKALDIETASKKPSPDVQGLAESGLGEIYARQGKVPEATAAYDDAAKVNPAQAAFVYTNAAKIFYQVAQTAGDAKTIEAQIATADKALATNPDPKNPNTALLYYLKGQGMISAPGAVQEDPKTHKLTAPPGSVEAFQKYLELAPDGQFATDVKGILAGFNAPVSSSYKAGKKS
ncbi:MAG TPA: carboxypeptidase regulatory-like domain-containing protein [Terracidiphilus sp.]|nr:carboxypeptidase regulatory-like domain-containing protein [Terracidiphilus sp.]